MYQWMWHALPGPIWLRVMQVALLAVVVVVVLFEGVFPVIAPRMPFNDGTISETGS